MSNEISTIESLGLPAELAGFFQAELQNNDLAKGISSGGFPVISIKGSKWAVKRGEDKYNVKDDEGMQSPYIDAIIVKSSTATNKVYYENKYSEGDDSAPTCFSNDGIKPDSSVENPVCSSCATCPKNEWGSRITENGAKAKECQDSKRLAVLMVSRFPKEIDYAPALLRVPATSLKAFATYSNNVTKKGLPVAAVVTRIKFDDDAAYPKLCPEPLRPLDADLAKLLIDYKDDPTIEEIISGGGVSGDSGTQSKPAEKIEVKQIEEVKAEVKPTPAPKSESVGEAVANVLDGLDDL